MHIAFSAKLDDAVVCKILANVTSVDRVTRIFSGVDFSVRLSVV